MAVNFARELASTQALLRGIGASEGKAEPTTVLEFGFSSPEDKR